MVNPLHIDLQSLRIFLLVVEQRSLTKAAESVQLTLSAISKRMAELESVTGCVLLTRQARGVEPTAAGRALYEHAGRVLGQVNTIASVLGDYANGVRGHVRLWANTSAIIQFLPGDLGAFLSANPTVRIDLEERLSHETVEAINAGNADLGIFADNVPAPGIEKQVYREDELVLLLPRTHRLASSDEIAFVQTLDENYIGLKSGSSLLDRMRQAALAADRSLKLRMQMASFDAIYRMIEAGLGIGILPRTSVRPEVAAAGLRMLRLTDSWAHRTLWLGVRSLEAMTPETARLFAFLSTRLNPLLAQAQIQAPARH